MRDSIRSIDCECGGDTWTRDYRGMEPTFTCTNCYHSRKRVVRKRGTKMTQSQEREMLRIKSYFLTRHGSLKTFNAEMSAGFLWVKVATTDSVWTSTGGFFGISRRGKAVLHNYSGLYGSAEHLAEDLGVSYAG